MKYKYVELINAVTLWHCPQSTVTTAAGYDITDGESDKSWCIVIRKENKDFAHYIPKTNVKTFTELVEEKPKLKIKE